MNTRRLIRAGTRGSALALWQTEYVIGRLAAAWPALEFRADIVRSRGDRDQHTPLPSLGGKGLFTAELELGLRTGTMDIAVHSLKDLPIADPEGLVTAAVLARDEARDVLISRRGAMLDDLPANAIIGTSSTRRCAQLLARRPDLHVQSIRGNVDTRLRKLDEGLYDAIILAGAGIKRMGLAARVTQWLPVEWFTPAPGQGALAIQCRANDAPVIQMLQSIHDAELAQLVHSERQFLAALGGGCSEPVGAYAVRDPGGITLQAWFSTPDGQRRWSETVQDNAHNAGSATVAHNAARAAQAAVGQGNSHSALFAQENRPPRIVLTRSRTEDLADCRAVLAAGMQPVLAPMIAMTAELTAQELAAAVGKAASYDWLIFTSANAVRIFAELWQAAGGTPTDFAGVAVAAVGPHTAEAARRLGFEVAYVPAAYSAAGLGADAARFAGQRILLPCSAAGAPDLVSTLAEHAADVVEIPLYHPTGQTLDAFALRALEAGVDVITFASPSAVRALHGEVLAHASLHGLLTRCPLACIGPQTAAAATELGLEVALISETHTMDALIRLVADTFSTPAKAG
ncbi:MAG: hydroxymethylbilane synthase [Litorilinea sp.]